MSTPSPCFLPALPIRRRFLPQIHRICAFLIGVSSLTILAGCDDPANLNPFAPACPTLDVQGSIADYVHYDSKNLDTGHLIAHTQIIAVHGDCRNGPQDSHHRPLTRVRLSLDLLQQYGPAFQKQDKPITIPYFIVVMRNREIIDKKLFSIDIKPDSTTTTQHVSTPLRFIDIPAGPTPQSNPYTLEIGFQLSHESLNYNRIHLHPAHFKERTPSSINPTP